MKKFSIGTKKYGSCTDLQNKGIVGFVASGFWLLVSRVQKEPIAKTVMTVLGIGLAGYGTYHLGKAHKKKCKW